MTKIRSLWILVVISFLFSSCETLDLIKNSEDYDTGVGRAVTQSKKSISKATEKISPENEYYIGRSVAASILSKYPLYKKAPGTVSYLNKICGAITSVSDTPYLYKGYHVAILDSDDINAIATPGGHIFISRGLLECTDSEDAVAAVIAHEVAHIHLKHSIKAVKTSRATDAIVKSGVAAGSLIADATGKVTVSEDVVDSYNEVSGKIANTLVDTGFSKANEFEADGKALKLMNQAGYDPHAMLDMLELIKTASKNSKTGWSMTHPSPDERIFMAKIILSNMEERGEFLYTDKSIRQKRFKNNIGLK